MTPEQRAREFVETGFRDLGVPSLEPYVQIITELLKEAAQDEREAPAGWKLVPPEPTTMMIRAYQRAISNYIDALPEPERAKAKGAPRGYRVRVKAKIIARYQAMFAAAPVFVADKNAMTTADACIDCDGTGRYPTGTACKSCGGSGRVLPGDGVAVVSTAQRGDG